MFAERYCASTCGVTLTVRAKISMVRTAEERTVSVHNVKDELMPSQNGGVGKGHYRSYVS